jgi:hypothetical protein
MTGKHRIVVSAENNAYMAWQCKLFYFSCFTRLNHQPIIIVHETGRDWHPDFYDLVKAGCAVHSAPNYRSKGRDDYACRNHPGSLINAAEICDAQDEFIVLCDPDMIFARSTDFPEFLAGEFSSYIDYNRAFVDEARLSFGIEREMSASEKETLRCAVPYIIPRELASEFGRNWLQAVDAFVPRKWEDVMYAFGLTVVKLGLEVNVTHLTDHNYSPDEQVRAPIIHYCYGDERWSKRNYFTDERAGSVWYPEAIAAERTILGEVLSQLKEARDFYRVLTFQSDAT